MSTGDDSRSRALTLALALALFLGTLAVYAGVAGHDFVNYDDAQWQSWLVCLLGTAHLEEPDLCWSG